MGEHQPNSTARVTITVQKLDHMGRLVTSYQGQIVRQTASLIVVEAHWQRDRLELPYVTFEPGDRFVEFYFTDRWYNIFEIHTGADDRLKGWYCNFSRPAVFKDTLLSAVDLELDLFVYPNGATRLLDEAEFNALDLQHSDPEAWQSVRAAVAELRARVAARRAPFSSPITHHESLSAL